MILVKLYRSIISSEVMELSFWSFALSIYSSTMRASIIKKQRPYALKGVLSMKNWKSALTLFSAVAVIAVSLGASPALAQDKAAKPAKAAAHTTAASKPKTKVTKTKSAKKVAKKAATKATAAKAAATPAAKTAPAKK